MTAASGPDFYERDEQNIDASREDVPTPPAARKSDLRLLWPFGWWARLDTIGHMLHLPNFVQRHLCDRFERSLDQSYWIAPTQGTSSSSSQVVTTWTWSRGRHRG